MFQANFARLRTSTTLSRLSVEDSTTSTPASRSVLNCRGGFRQQYLSCRFEDHTEQRLRCLPASCLPYRWAVCAHVSSSGTYRCASTFSQTLDWSVFGFFLDCLVSVHRLCTRHSFRFISLNGHMLQPGGGASSETSEADSLGRQLLQMDSSPAVKAHNNKLHHVRYFLPWHVIGSLFASLHSISPVSADSMLFVLFLQKEPPN